MPALGLPGRRVKRGTASELHIVSRAYDGLGARSANVTVAVDYGVHGAAWIVKHLTR